MTVLRRIWGNLFSADTSKTYCFPFRMGLSQHLIQTRETYTDENLGNFVKMAKFAKFATVLGPYLTR